MEFRNAEPPEIGNGAASATPRIVNGMPVRPREKIKLWQFGICLLPDLAVLFVAIALVMHRLARYLEANRPEKS